MIDYQMHRIVRDDPEPNCKPDRARRIKPVRRIKFPIPNLSEPIGHLPMVNDRMSQADHQDRRQRARDEPKRQTVKESMK